MQKLLVAAVLLLAGSAAHAADGFYVGAGVARSNLDDIMGSTFSLDSNNVSWKALVGFRPIDFFAVEANYMDFGNRSGRFGVGTAAANAKAVALYGMGFIPLGVPFLDFFAKAGVAHPELKGNFIGAGQHFYYDDQQAQLAYGAGAQANWGPVSARFEYDGFDVRRTNGLSMYTADLIWTFL